MTNKDNISGLTILELNDLVTAIENKFDVKAKGDFSDILEDFCDLSDLKDLGDLLTDVEYTSD